MNYKLLILLFLVSALVTGCNPGAGSEQWVTDEDVVLVEVDGEPISLPMLEFMMANRGVSEDDHEAMRGLLDELIRLRVVANAAINDGIASDAKLRAQRAIRDMEALQIAYFTDIYERYPVTPTQIQETYARQLERSGTEQYQLQTIAYGSQSEALIALVGLNEGEFGFDELLSRAEAENRAITTTAWIDRSQLPERIHTELSDASVGQSLSLPLPAPNGQDWLVAQIVDQRPLEAPALEEVREGIARTLVRQRLEALVDDLYEAADIKPMLEMDAPAPETPSKD